LSISDRSVMSFHATPSRAMRIRVMIQTSFFSYQWSELESIRDRRPTVVGGKFPINRVRHRSTTEGGGGYAIKAARVLSISGQRLTRLEAYWAESIRWLVDCNKVYATASHKARRLTNLILGSRPHLHPSIMLWEF